MVDLLWFALTVIAVAGVGVGIGLLLAGRLSRRGEHSVDDDGTFTSAVDRPDEDGAGAEQDATGAGDAPDGDDGAGGDDAGGSDGGDDGD